MYDWLYAKLILKIKNEDSILTFLYSKPLLKSRKRTDDELYGKN